ncbi:helix-turn-helix domain-containing protein [Microbacterium jejuense]|uniref:Helix-turn-helix domain-containing protein n=1 Tax=Microbacterium jejuense TaxID=1263637 RepID=A0ABS7HRG8_9MICO|nr:helix-turn-helix domain-containing protein [Microbacterium jejuense]MBW9095572.1 helix-turn-helix domain-containing protein [Microbacterium jejuense]
MSFDVTPTRRGTGGSPFLTAAAAAKLAGLTPATLTRRLANGELPGYRFGRRWFVPEAEFRRQLRRRAWMVRADAEPAVIRELTRTLPAFLTDDDLERFFGVRRTLLGEVLRMPSFTGRGGGTTIAVLERTLLSARNGCTPCVAEVVPHGVCGAA